jgi:hypothetical protein
MGPMKTSLYVLAAISMLGGIIWFLQGINVLPGSFMTGQLRWAIYGGIAFSGGLALIAWARRRN